jgi:hypothetical protein
MRLLHKTGLKPVCVECGSSRIFADACAKWDPDALRWVHLTSFEHGSCAHCRKETVLVWVPLATEEPEEIHETV